MKKFFTFMTMVLMTLGATTTMTSCSEDQMIGMSLEGTWVGNMYMQQEWSGNVYKVAESEITFTADPFRVKTGSGYWVDYYANNNYVANHIRWDVHEQRITIHFVEDGGTLIIDDFDICNGYFTGYIYDDSGNPIKFQLKKVYEPGAYNYDNYNYGWGYWDDYYYGYSKGMTRSAGEMEKPVRHIVME